MIHLLGAAGERRAKLEETEGFVSETVITRYGSPLIAE
jgi:hypothetical protein